MIDQGELFSIPNPCRGICQVNNKGYCKGCLRSRKERFHWQEFTPFQRQLIINACEKRRQRILAARDAIAADEQTDTDTPQLTLVLDDDAASVNHAPNSNHEVDGNQPSLGSNQNHESRQERITNEEVIKEEVTKEQSTREIKNKNNLNNSDSHSDSHRKPGKDQQQQDLFG